jgi:hypothetical protein
MIKTVNSYQLSVTRFHPPGETPHSCAQKALVAGLNPPPARESVTAAGTVHCLLFTVH